VISSFGIKVKNLKGVTLEINGVLEASTYWDQWPLNTKSVLNMLEFYDCNGLIIKGTGLVDGLGYDWWVREWLRQNTKGRPNLLLF